MSDASVAEIARRLAISLVKRAHSRSDGDTKAIQALQSELCMEVAGEVDSIARGTIGAKPE